MCIRDSYCTQDSVDIAFGAVWSQTQSDDSAAFGKAYGLDGFYSIEISVPGVDGFGAEHLCHEFGTVVIHGEYHGRGPRLSFCRTVYVDTLDPAQTFSQLLGQRSLIAVSYTHLEGKTGTVITFN